MELSTLNSLLSGLPQPPSTHPHPLPNNARPPRAPGARHAAGRHPCPPAGPPDRCEHAAVAILAPAAALRRQNALLARRLPFCPCLHLKLAHSPSPSPPLCPACRPRPQPGRLADARAPDHRQGLPPHCRHARHPLRRLGCRPQLPVHQAVSARLPRLKSSSRPACPPCPTCARRVGTFAPPRTRPPTHLRRYFGSLPTLSATPTYGQFQVIKPAIPPENVIGDTAVCSNGANFTVNCNKQISFSATVRPG